MTQFDFGVLEITHTGAALATKLNGVVGALLTQHRGPARPAYVQPGMLWIDDSGSLWLLKLYDGTGDIAIAAVDPDTHAVVTHFVPDGRKLRAGKGLKLNGVAGTDAVPAEADLTADLLFGFDLSAFAALQALWNAGADEGLHPISPAQLKAAIAALAPIPENNVKAWVQFVVVGTTLSIQSSKGVSSVVRNQTGDYTVNFSTAFADALYGVTVSNVYQDNEGASWLQISKTAAAFRFGPKAVGRSAYSTDISTATLQFVR